jgi:hypothetical protein
MWTDENIRRQYMSAREKAIYHARKAQGLCPHCGKRQPYRDMVSCLPCRARHSRYSRHYNYRQREMRRQGLRKEPEDAAD